MSSDHLVRFQISHVSKSWLELQLTCLGRMACDPPETEGDKKPSLTHFPVSPRRPSDEVWASCHSLPTFGGTQCKTAQLESRSGSSATAYLLTHIAVVGSLFSVVLFGV